MSKKPAAAATPAEPLPNSFAGVVTQMELSRLERGGNGGHARKTNIDHDVGRLANHIREKGILIPLMVRRIVGLVDRDARPDHVVIDGNRRWAALHAIYDGSNIDPLVPVIVHEVTAGMDESLATFVMTVPLHPVDEYEAFAYLKDGEGLSVETIARRYGLKELQVRQSLALGSLSPLIRNDWRAGKINNEIAEALTLAPAFEKQESVYRSLSKSGQLYRYNVRRAILGDPHDLAATLKFVGEADYRTAGGVISIDLFGKEKIVSDPELLDRLGEAKMERAIEDLESTWAWVTRSDDPAVKDRHSWERIYPGKNDKFAVGDMARSGAVVTLNYDGDLQVTGGWVKPDGKRRKGKAASASSGVAGAPAEKKPAISEALKRRMDHWQRLAIKNSLKDDANDFTALDRMISGLLAGLIQTDNPQWHSTPQLITDAFPKLRDALPYDVVIHNSVKAFDAADYFGGISADLCVKHLLEMDGKWPKADLAKMKKAERVKLAVDEAAACLWLPAGMRPAGYALDRGDGIRPERVKAAGTTTRKQARAAGKANHVKAAAGKGKKARKAR